VSGARRRVVRSALALLPVAALVTGGILVARGEVPCTVVALQPACRLAVAPGPTLDALDAVDIAGAPSYASAGELVITTIEVRDVDGWRTWWELRALPGHDVVPRTLFVPAGQDLAEVAAANRDVMGESQRRATRAALGALGLPLDAEGRPTGAAAGLEVAIDTGVVGGPSAGLVLALAIVDRLGPEDLTGGLVVAGTGTVGEDGRVGAVGGVAQKLTAALARDGGRRSADVFLVPRGELAAARRVEVGAELLVVPVDDLAGALDALAVLRAGGRPADAVVIGPGR
jgi:PDZ domain-containing protein